MGPGHLAHLSSLYSQDCAKFRDDSVLLDDSIVGADDSVMGCDDNVYSPMPVTCRDCDTMRSDTYNESLSRPRSSNTSRNAFKALI